MIALQKQFLNSDGELPIRTNKDDLDQHIHDGYASKARDLDNDEIEVDDDAAAAVTVTMVAATTVIGTVALATVQMDFLPCGWFVYKTISPCAKGNTDPIFLS